MPDPKKISRSTVPKSPRHPTASHGVFGPAHLGHPDAGDHSKGAGFLGAYLAGCVRRGDDAGN